MLYLEISLESLDDWMKIVFQLCAKNRGDNDFGGFVVGCDLVVRLRFGRHFMVSGLESLCDRFDGIRLRQASPGLAGGTPFNWLHWWKESYK